MALRLKYRNRQTRAVLVHRIHYLLYFLTTNFYLLYEFLLLRLDFYRFPHSRGKLLSYPMMIIDFVHFKPDRIHMRHSITVTSRKFYSSKTTFFSILTVYLSASRLHFECIVIWLDMILLFIINVFQIFCESFFPLYSRYCYVWEWPLLPYFSRFFLYVALNNSLASFLMWSVAFLHRTLLIYYG